MKVLVTGGAGFIGMNLCNRLLLDEQEVVAVDIHPLRNKKLNEYSSYHFYQIDINDNRKLEEIFINYQFDIVYHLASNTSIALGQEDINIDLKNTFATTLSILELIAKYNISKLVFTSSSTVYGNCQNAFSENDPHIYPISYYGAAKLAGEAFVSAYSSLYGIQTWVLRLCNVIGKGVTHGVVYDICQQITSGVDRLKLLGTGAQEKPFIYIDDALDGILYIVNHATDRYNLFLIGNDTTISLREIVKIILKTLKVDISVEWTNKETTWPGDVQQYQYNIDKVSLLGWKPIYSSHEAIIKSIK